ncbi:MAG: anthranilate synthase component I [Armatimonadota bacterium]|nr:anthranilate synthase component I [Armatimonadota bacterium]
MFWPDRDTFRARAARGNLIPVYREILADLETPVSAFRKAASGSYAFLLESVTGGERLARYSFLGADPFLVFQSRGTEVTITEGERRSRRLLRPGEDPLHLLKELLGRYRYVPDPALPPFSGGAVGYLSYDLVRFFEHLPQHAVDDLHLPDCQLVFTDTLLIFDHVKHKILALCNAQVNGDPDTAYDAAVEKIDALTERLRSPLPPADPAATRPTRAVPPGPPVSNFTHPLFEKAVERAKEYIAAGDAIQVVLSQRFARPLAADPFDVYRALRSLNPSPYMYFLRYGDLHLVGSSPEVLVTEKGGTVTVRPIAGTRPRGESDEEDRQLAAELLADEKERAEHIMLVDLGRNDVGRVARPGSVRVDELMVVEKYSHVMHLVSNVVGELLPGKDAFDVLRACFPAGTVSGAPKVRAMEIIEELEPTRRGPYAGAIGYFSYSGNMDTCITIRTLVLKEGMAYLQAGAGIVADSVPEREYQETVNKARALVRALEMAEEGLS